MVVVVMAVVVHVIASEPRAEVVQVVVFLSARKMTTAAMAPLGPRKIGINMGDKDFIIITIFAFTTLSRIHQPHYRRLHHQLPTR